MKIKYQIYTQSVMLFLVLFLFSCESNNIHKMVNTHEKVTYNIGFPVRSAITFSDRKKEYYAFCDFATHKKISICSIDGNHLFYVPLKQILKEVPEGLIEFQPISIDSFALLSKYTNRVYIINQNGQIIYKKDYSKFLLNGIELAGIRVSNGVFYSGISYRGGIDTLGRKLINDELLHYRHEKRFFYKLFCDSSFLKVSTNISLGLDSTKSRFTKDNELAVEGTNYLTTKNKTYYFSAYSDSIYVFNKRYELKQIKKIKSQFYKIDMRPIKWSDYKRSMKLVSENFWIHSFIQDILYDKYKQRFYCVIRGPGDIATRYMPFSIIILDKDLNLLHEKKFDGHIFKPNVFIGKKGLYIKNANNSNISELTYTIFRYE